MKPTPVPCSHILLVALVLSACSSPDATDAVDSTETEVPVETPDVTVPPQETQYDFWPNPLSKTNGDQWLYENHESIKRVNPNVLVLSFGNARSTEAVQSKVDQVINAFAESSRADGYENPAAEPQLNYNLVKFVDLRDGIDGRADAPADYPFENSSLYPRREDSTNPWIDYSKFFSDEFAEYYGFQDPDNTARYQTLCELIDSGTINELWFAASGDVPDGAAYEVLERKQVYNSDNEPLSGQFNNCAGNGCFNFGEANCSSSVRIGFINDNRGPGCYLHSMGHGIESVGRKQVIPSFSDWFIPFSGFDLNTRYGTPFETFYEACELSEECLNYPTTMSVDVRRFGTYENYQPYCGNVHFPPNADKHYGSFNDEQVASQCDNFGRPNSVGVTETTLVNYVDWRDNSYAQDCSGEFLAWWYQHMPAYGTGREFGSGESMKSIWPFLFY